MGLDEVAMESSLFVATLVLHLVLMVIVAVMFDLEVDGCRHERSYMLSSDYVVDSLEAVAVQVDWIDL